MKSCMDPEQWIISQVDRRSSGKSGLQVACHQGHREVVQFLLTSGADMSQQDEDGDTALHYAVFG